MDPSERVKEKRFSYEMTDLTPTTQKSTSYIPKTLKSMNNPRYTILPAFPTSIHSKEPPPLLLANVPMNELDSNQRAHRERGRYPSIYSMDRNKSDIPSYFHDTFQLFMNSLTKHYRVDESILDFNLHRFSQCFKLFAQDLIRQHNQPATYFLLDEHQKRYAFEFYLQVDVDLFFMKTCTYRQGKLRLRGDSQSLFCFNEPQTNNYFKACNNCSLCQPAYNPSCRERLGPMIRFGDTNGHKFRNGYRTLLNCPVNCQTNNIIYVLTCPCDEYEYIGETTQRLIDRLRHHRQQLNRMFHEFLLGERNIQKNQPHPKTKETLTKDRMFLYRHTVRCPSAMQIFLNFNPIYWCFAPLRLPEPEIQDRKNPTLPDSLILLDSSYSTSIASKDRNARMATENTRSDDSVRSYMRRLPPIPEGYDFSIRQRAKQFQYFKQRHDMTHQQNPAMDLYNAAVIAVLPEDASETVRRFVETLFITHTEAKLNTSGRLVQTHHNNDNDRYDSDIPYHLAEGCSPTSEIAIEIQMRDRGEWCFDLIFPHHRDE